MGSPQREIATAVLSKTGGGAFLSTSGQAASDLEACAGARTRDSEQPFTGGRQPNPRSRGGCDGLGSTCAQPVYGRPTGHTPAKGTCPELSGHHWGQARRRAAPQHESRRRNSGNTPTLARCASSSSVPVCHLDVWPSERTRTVPLAPREATATSELWYPMRERPKQASVYMDGG